MPFRSLMLLLVAAAPAEVPHLGRMEHPPIRESSGLALSNVGDDLLWTLCDSGNPATLFAVGLDGSLRGEVRIAGATNLDWESLDSADGKLWIADVGDNLTWRPTVTIYRLAEPDPGAGQADAERIELGYPDRARDCEALFIAGETLYLVSKTGAGRECGVYSVEAPRPRRVNRLTRRLDLTVPDQVTGAAISRDGRRIALVGYRTVHVWAGDGDPLALLQRAPRRFALPFREQTEAIAFAGYDLLVSSEQRNLYRIPAAAYEQSPQADDSAARPVSAGRGR